jgi:hypothetical protein
MKFLMILNASLGALCLTMAVMQAVVSLMYAFIVDLSPRLAEDLPLLLGSTAIFLAIGLLFLAGFFGLLRRKPWRWPMQGAIAVALVPAALVLYRLMT